MVPEEEKLIGEAVLPTSAYVSTVHSDSSLDGENVEPDGRKGLLFFEIPSEADLPDLLHFLNKPALERSAISSDALSIDAIQRILTQQGRENRVSQQGMPALAAVKLDGEYISLYLLSDIDAYHSTCAISCIIDSLVFEALLHQGLELLLNFLFLEKRVHRVEIMIREGHENDRISSLLQKSKFCFEGIKRQALRKHDEAISDAGFHSLKASWIDVMIFSILSGEREEDVSEGVYESSAESLKESNDQRLLYKARYEGIDSIIVRAVVMSESAQLPQEVVSESSSPQDLCLLLLKREEQVGFNAIEELPGTELKNDEESLQSALQRALLQETGTTIKEPILFLTSFDFQRADGKRVREFVFRLKIEGDVAVNSSTHSGFRWVPLQHLVKTPLHPEIMTILFTCNDRIDYISETHYVRDEEVILEEVRSHLSELNDALAHGLHVNAYAARGFGLQQQVGISLRDRSGHIIGGVLGESQYGGYFCQKLWVDPQHWGHGWKKRLVDRVEHVAQAEGAKFIIFSCMDWEFVRPLQRLGYRIEWQRSGYDRGSTLIYLRKDLTQQNYKKAIAQTPMSFLH